MTLNKLNSIHQNNNELGEDMQLKYKKLVEKTYFRAYYQLANDKDRSIFTSYFYPSKEELTKGCTNCFIVSIEEKKFSFEEELDTNSESISIQGD